MSRLTPGLTSSEDDARPHGLDKTVPYNLQEWIFDALVPAIQLTSNVSSSLLLPITQAETER